ncbi:MAG TPA: site-2 protease family protein, partial [Patescibacteria group bacterium]|nr:site-2 protease family protein [Patescibacteria group bacterium]
MFASNPEALIQAAILIGIFLILAFPIHEFAHAWVAYRLGDGTAKMYGRLTLNPIVHFDPFGGLLL